MAEERNYSDFIQNRTIALARQTALPRWTKVAGVLLTSSGIF